MPANNRGDSTEEKVELGVGFGDGFKDEVFMPYIRELGAKLTLIKISWINIEPNPPAEGIHTYQWIIL